MASISIIVSSALALPSIPPCYGVHMIKGQTLRQWSSQPRPLSMTFATLRALHAVIGTAIDEIERRYRHNSPQLDYPSLDEPCYPGAECTSDEELAKTLQADSRVAAASMMIVAACRQLSATVNKPWAGLMEDVKGVKSSYHNYSAQRLLSNSWHIGPPCCMHPLPRSCKHRGDPPRG